MDTKRARSFLFWLFVGAGIGLVILAGCEALDNAVQDANDWAVVGRDALDSPAGRGLPPDIRLYGSLAVNVLMGSAAAYKQWRLSQMGKTTKAIVRGIQAFEETTPPASKPEPSLKGAIATEMRKLRIMDTGDKLVDRFKTS